MKTCWLVLVAAFLALLRPIAAADVCAGPTSPAKYRAVVISDIIDNSPAGVKAHMDLYAKWIKSCGGLVVREGHAPAITQDPGLFGLKSLPNNSYMGDFGAWSDWRSLEDLKACVAKGVQEGTVTTLRRQSLRVARIVFPLDTKVVTIANANTNACSKDSFAPAKVRMLIAYVLKDPASADKAVALQNQVSAAAAVKPVRYGTGGRAALGKDEYVWGPGITKTADWGVWYDFKDEATVRAYFAPSDAATHQLRTQLRSLAAGAMRIAIPLP